MERRTCLCISRGQESHADGHPGPECAHQTSDSDEDGDGCVQMPFGLGKMAEEWNVDPGEWARLSIPVVRQSRECLAIEPPHFEHLWRDERQVDRAECRLHNLRREKRFIYDGCVVQNVVGINVPEVESNRREHRL